MPLSNAVSNTLKKGVIIFIGNEFTIRFDRGFMVSNRDEYQMFLQLIKRLDHKQFDFAKEAWNIPPEPDAIELIRKLVGWGLTATETARKQISEQVKRVAQVRAESTEYVVQDAELELVDAPGLAEKMKPYQRVGTVFMVGRKRSYNGDEMGLGKSLQCLAAFEAAHAFPALILCPPKLKQNWVRESEKWLPHRTVSTNVRMRSEITVLGYTEAHKYVNYGLFDSKKAKREAAKIAGEGKKFMFPDFHRVRGIACDEGHQIKNAGSRRTQAATAIAELCDARFRTVMSGTPIENRPAELVAPLVFLGVLDQFGGWLKFVKRYCDATRQGYGWNLSGASNTRELYERMSRICYIRRKKKDVLKELPDKLQSVIEVEINNTREYEAIDRDLKAFMITQGKLMTAAQLKVQAMMKVGLLRSCVGRGKAAWIVDWVDQFLESGEKFVIYANHRSVQKALVDGLKKWNPAVVLGGCPNVSREEDKFMGDPSCRVFIGSAVAAGFGLTLTAASHIGIAELMWTHSKHQQIEDRVHRIGQHDCVNVYYFIAPGTIDEDIWSLVSDKAQIASSAADGQELTEAELLKNLKRKLL